MIGVQFGQVTYLQNEHLRRGNWGTNTLAAPARELAEYYRKRKGIRAQQVAWDSHQFVLTGKDLRAYESAQQQFDQAVAYLRRYIFEGQNYYRDGQKQTLADFVQVVQQNAEQARKSVIQTLKSARVWQNTRDIRLNVSAKLDRAQSRAVMQQVFAEAQD